MNSPALKFPAPAARVLLSPTLRLIAALAALYVSFSAPAVAQTLAQRLILKDGTYQSITKYEIHGDRVRYFSAERGEWEELPKSLVDWDATNKFQQGLQQGAPSPEAIELDRELEAERQAELARSPEVVPGLHLPDEGGVFILDTYENQPQLAEVQQSGSDLDKSTKLNILRSVVNPLAGARQSIELPGAHAKVQSHSTLPSVYVNLDAENGAPATAQATAGEPQPLAPTERFKIIRVEVKGNKRTAGAVKIAINGNMKTDERIVAATASTLTGGWVKLTPTEPLAAGEYAVAEMLGKEGMNIYVWDFGVNPAAPANAFVWKPQSPDADVKPAQTPQLKERDKQ